MRMKFPKVIPEYTKFQGGLDQESPALSIYPGALIASLNYVTATNGGYSRIDGYERFDGQASPSDAIYYYLGITLTGTINVGDTVTQLVSTATGVVVISESDHINVTKVTGTFDAINVIQVGAVTQATVTSVLISGESIGLADAIAMDAAATEYRSDIAKPTGSLAIRGLALLKGVLYCFADNAGGTAGTIYKQTSSGWSLIILYHELSFNTGIAEISDGDSITQLVSGATATVKRVVLESGTWTGGTATGRLILDSIVGSFDATNDIQVTAVTKVTSTSLTTQITISPGGRYETVVYNFYGSLDTKRIYGCDGVNAGFEFDGAIYVPISTGMTTDTPEYVYTHKKQLFFSFKGSSQNSGIGEPYQWTPVTGAAEIALGDNITGYVQLPGKALAILARNLSEQLLGSDVSDFVLDSISNEVGCLPRTAQRIGHAYCLDDRGIIRIVPTQSYGNFVQNTVSRRIQKAIKAMRKVVIASTVYKTDDQYRLYGSDGTGICMTILEDQGGVAFTQFNYPDIVSCIISGEDSLGEDVIFFGSTDGMVYQADKGSSFDGADIEAFIVLPFNNSKSPTTLKTYRKAIIEMTATRYTKIRYSPAFSYGNLNLPAHVTKEIETQGSGGLWDISTWDEFFYDSDAVSTPSFRLSGTGINISLIIYTKSTIDLGHKFDGAIIHYTLRRLVR